MAADDPTMWTRMVGQDSTSPTVHMQTLSSFWTIGRCQSLCVARGFNGFVVRNDRSYFKSGACEEIEVRSRADQGSVLHLAPVEKRALGGHLAIGPCRAREDILSSDWFPAEIASLLCATDALNFAASATSLRCVRLCSLSDRCDRWEAAGRWGGALGDYQAHEWQALALNAGDGAGSASGSLVPLPSDGDAAGGVHTVFVRMEWCDQGWGNQKGMVSVVDTSKGDAGAPGDYKVWGECVVAGREPAPHQWSPLSLTFCPASVSSGPYSLWYRVGGGGGHVIAVRECEAWSVEYCARVRSAAE